MSNEINVNCTLTYQNPPVGIPLIALTNAIKLFTLSGVNTTGTSVMQVPTTAGGTTIPLGPLTGATLGWACFVNLDLAHTIKLLNAVSGTAFADLPPNGVAVFFIDAVITAPAAIAITGACEMQYFVIAA